MEDASCLTRAQGGKISGSNYSKVELIYTLANAIKHRNELEIQCEKILWSSDSENELFAQESSYKGYTLKVLNACNVMFAIAG